MAGLIAAGVLLAPAARAQTATTKPAGGEGVASPDAAVREQACRQIEAQIVSRIAVLAGLENSEASDRAADVLEHHAAVLDYLREILARPTEQRVAAVRWALEDQHLALISAVLSRRVEVRLAASSKLLGDDSPEADALLARLIKDRDWDVSGAAIAMVPKRPPSKPIVDALWDRSVGVNNNPRIEQPKPVRFRNKVLNGVFYGSSMFDYSIDNSAYEALVALKSPLVEAKIVETINSYISSPNGPMAQIFQPYNPAAQNFTSLVGEYKPKAAVPLMAKLLKTSESAKQTGMLPTGGFFWSNRTYPLVMFLKLTGQDPADFQLTRRREFGNGQWTAPDEKTHHEAEAKALAWYEQHRSDFPADPGAPKPSPATTSAPATGPSTVTPQPAH